MCKYCDLDKDGIAEPLVSGLGVCCELVIEKNNYYLVIYGDSEVYSEPVYFCPFCGKSLKVEVKPTTPEECATVFDYLRLLDTFTDRKGPAYEKWRYASDYVMNNHGKMTDQEMIARIEKKFNNKKNDKSI